MTRVQYSIGEVAVCRWCGLGIKRTNDYTWESNYEGEFSYAELSRTDEYNPNEEPWWSACPGSPEALEVFPTFGLYHEAEEKDEEADSDGFTQGYKSRDHEPMDPLARLVHENESS